MKQKKHITIIFLNSFFGISINTLTTIIKKHIQLLFSSLLILTSMQLHAQLENANWYFGDNTFASQNGAGLDFNNNTVSVLTDGKTEESNFFTSTLSDENGDLLFYTDGRSVWNKNHVKMPHGDNTLNGASQTVSIVPVPGNDEKYYVFTISFGTPNQSNGYYYSIIDLNLENDLGDLELGSINIPLNLFPFIDEEGNPNFQNEIQRRNNMVVAKHSDGESYWLILNPFDYFFAIKIDSNGISSNPIITHEDISSLDYNFNIRGASGISISPNMDKLSYFTNRSNAGSQSNAFTVMNFNNSTGFLSQEFFTIDNPSFSPVPGYASEFSANGNYLYLLNDIAAPYWIYQLDVQNINNNPIFLGFSVGSGDSETDLPTLVRGINDKIYVPNSNNLLGIINNPNLSGSSSNYVNNQINLGTNIIAKRLPQQVQVHNIIDSNCPVDLVITLTVNPSENDIQESSNTLIATNIIKSGGNAEYDSVKFVKLLQNFHAKAGSTFRAYIEGCTNSASRFSSYSKDSPNFPSLKMYPNPIKQVLNLESPNSISSWEVFDLFGRSHIKDEIETNNITKIQLDVETLSSGSYILKVIFNNGESISKQIIKK